MKPKPRNDRMEEARCPICRRVFADPDPVNLCYRCGEAAKEGEDLVERKREFDARREYLLRLTDNL
jgi:rRNA maturation endonuclease Nob1